MALWENRQYDYSRTVDPAKVEKLTDDDFILVPYGAEVRTRFFNRESGKVILPENEHDDMWYASEICDLFDEQFAQYLTLGCGIDGLHFDKEEGVYILSIGR